MDCGRARVTVGAGAGGTCQLILLMSLIISKVFLVGSCMEQRSSENRCRVLRIFVLQDFFGARGGTWIRCFMAAAHRAMLRRILKDLSWHMGDLSLRI